MLDASESLSALLNIIRNKIIQVADKRMHRTFGCLLRGRPAAGRVSL